MLPVYLKHSITSSPSFLFTFEKPETQSRLFSFWFVSRSSWWNLEAVNCNRTAFTGMPLDVACLHSFISQGCHDPAAAITDASCEADTMLSQHHDQRLFKPCFPSQKPFQKAQAHLWQCSSFFRLPGQASAAVTVTVAQFIVGAKLRLYFYKKNGRWWGGSFELVVRRRGKQQRWRPHLTYFWLG